RARGRGLDVQERAPVVHGQAQLQRQGRPYLDRAARQLGQDRACRFYPCRLGTSRSSQPERLLILNRRHTPSSLRARDREVLRLPAVLVFGVALRAAVASPIVGTIPTLTRPASINC